MRVGAALGEVCMYWSDTDGPLASTSPSITRRESEVLHWISAGKSDWEIGMILNISPKTVNYHVEKAKKRFGVTTRIQAVMTAMRLGVL
jgi:DNA-binding CsgD family transcriptional regulator